MFLGENSMSSIHTGSKVLAAALCIAALAGCNAVEDVKEGPTATLPTARVVLSGTISGLGSRRSLTLFNNNDNNSAVGVIGAPPATPIDSTDGSATTTGSTAVITPFTFGSLPEGTPYNVSVRNPYGRSCTVANGTGVLNRASPPNVTITCVPNVTRYNLTVGLDPAFSSSPSAKVQLATEEAIYQATVSPGATSVTFTNVLFYAGTTAAGAGNPAAPVGSPAFAWTVTASNMAGGVLNKCPVQGPTGTNPTANVPASGTTPNVLACSFTVSGDVRYSVPPGPATPAGSQVIGAGGLTVQLRSGQGEVRASATIPSGTSIAGPFSFTFRDSSNAPLQFQSNAAAVFDVAVSSQPAGQMCILGDGGFASVFNALVNGVPTSVTGLGQTATGATPSLNLTTGVLSGPVAGTRIIVWCRAKPSASGIILGTFRLTKQTAIIATVTTTKTRTGALTSTITSATTGPTYSPPIVAEYRPFDTTRQNSASNALITFFDDGTFLYGQHNSATNLEHGFYRYDTAAGTLQFTIHTDTALGAVNATSTTGTTFNFPAAAATPTIATTSNHSGINAAPGPIVIPGPAVTYPAPQRHQVMCNVSISSGYPRTISGRFGGYPTALPGCALGNSVNPAAAPADPAAPAAGAAPTTTTSTGNTGVQLDWELTEPRAVPNQMTGAWITADHREFWAFDNLTFYGFHAGVNGGAANMQSACFTLEDYTAASSFLTRRGSVNGCYAWNNPAAGVPLFDFIPTAVNTSPAPTVFPNFVGLFPGGATAIDGRSPSPIPFHVGPAATWFTTVPANFVQYFPTVVPFDSWCSGTSPSGIPAEVMGVRATLNGEPVTSPLVPVQNSPVYYCRQ
jgi:hypothetical protein